MRFTQVLGLGAACGFSPGQVRAMSLWEFTAATGGWLRAHVPGSDRDLTPEQETALHALLDGADDDN